MNKNERYIPALNFDWLTPLYDPLVKWFMPESKFKNRLVMEARIQPGQRILDVGCGTGTLAVLIKQAHPDAEVIGLDGDARILEIARRKANQTDVEITFEKGFAFQLPYADKSFDRIFSSLMFHHLATDNKRSTVSETLRVLNTGGELHVADFARPNKDLPAMLREAGFKESREYARYRTIFGTVRLWSAQLPHGGFEKV
jgi:ubiquinone/menaquinone biosynthesis C-methylase UbiE